VYNQKRRGHDLHADDSDFTLNILLNDSEKEFERGGDLTVMRCGEYNSYSHSGKIFTGHVSGKGIVHYGRAPHCSDDIQKGQRMNLIVWMKIVPSSFFKKVEESEKFAPNIFSGQLLPLEMQRQILSYLNATDLLRLGASCKYFYALVSNDGGQANFVWYKFFAKKHNAMFPTNAEEIAEIRKRKLDKKNPYHKLSEMDPETVERENLALISSEFDSNTNHYDLYKKLCKKEKHMYFNSSSNGMSGLMMKCAPSDEYAMEIQAPSFKNL